MTANHFGGLSAAFDQTHRIEQTTGGVGRPQQASCEGGCRGRRRAKRILGEFDPVHRLPMMERNTLWKRRIERQTNADRTVSDTDSSSVTPTASELSGAEGPCGPSGTNIEVALPQKCTGTNPVRVPTHARNVSCLRLVRESTAIKITVTKTKKNTLMTFTIGLKPYRMRPHR